ncbi:uncharacterized protein LOC121735915 isoform X2 [Aricia agestis]|nr:uncharacterized protein LOC121735915 isoform X2 [Aricia agestis]
MEILKDTSLSSRDECARAAAVLRWTLRQAHRNNCSGVQLARDLLVLGVPRAHAAALAETADSTRETYEGQVKSAGFMINKLTDATVSEGPEGTVETVKLTLHSDEVFSGEQKMAELLIDKTQVGTLLQELKKAKKIMDELDVQ